MNPSFEQTLIEVWRQTLVENAEVVELGTERYPVRLTPKRRLREVDFIFEGHFCHISATPLGHSPSCPDTHS